MLSGGEVNHRIDAGNEVGTEIVVARRSELHVNGHRDIGALEDLRAVDTTKLLMIDTMLLPEMNSGRDAQREMIVQAEVTKHANRKARTVVVNLRIPLFARLWVDVAVVLQLYILHVQPQEKAIVESPLVDIRAILHLPLLCRKAQGEE